MEEQVNIYKFFTFILSMVLFVALVVILVLSLGVVMDSPSASTQLSDTAVDQSKQEALLVAQQEATAFCQPDADCVGSDCDIAGDLNFCLDGHYLKQAQSNKNLDICDLVDNEREAVVCRDNVYMTIAITEQNLASCSLLSDEQQAQACSNEVNYYLAISNPDRAQQYCDRITATGLRATCFNKFVR